MQDERLPIHQNAAISRDVLDADYSYLQSHSSSKGDAKFYVNFFKKRKWYVVVPFFIIMPFTVLQYFAESPEYETHTRLLIENENLQVLNFTDLFPMMKGSISFYETEYNIIKSKKNIGEVVDILKLNNEEEEEEASFTDKVYKIFRIPVNVVKGALRMVQEKITILVLSARKSEDKTLSNNPTELQRREAVDQLYNAVDVEPLEDSKLVDIRISGSDPHKVAQQANTLAEIYIRNNLEKKLEASQKAISWLSNRTEILKKKIYDSEKYVQEFRQKNGLISLDIEEKNDISLARLESLNSAFTEVQKRKIETSNILDKYNKIIKNKNNIGEMGKISPMLENTLEADLKLEYMKIKNEYNALLKKYKPKHPIMIQKTDEVGVYENEIDSMLSSIQEKHDILKSTEENILEELEDQKDRVLKMRNDLIAYNALKRDAEIFRGLYFEASKRLREINLIQAVQTNNVSVVDKALVPLEPIPSTKGVVQIALGFILSASLGICAASVRGYFDNRFQNIAEVESLLQIPFLAVISRYASDRVRPNDPVMLRAPLSPAAEDYRSLRTKLHTHPLALKTLLVTSAVPSEGKSTTTVNLGIAFAHLGYKVLLVDTDLRRPSLHQHFHLSKEVGLSDILVNEADLPQVIQTTPIEHLKVLSAGTVSRNPSDLLSLIEMKQLIQQFRTEFDITIFDSPIALSLNDVEIIASEMDGVILVHSPRQCDKESVVEAKRLLQRAEANIIGVILSNISEKEQEYFYQQKHFRYEYHE